MCGLIVAAAPPQPIFMTSVEVLKSAFEAWKLVPHLQRFARNRPRARQNVTILIPQVYSKLAARIGKQGNSAMVPRLLLLIGVKAMAISNERSNRQMGSVGQPTLLYWILLIFVVTLVTLARLVSGGL